jgi:hypothetical protein
MVFTVSNARITKQASVLSLYRYTCKHTTQLPPHASICFSADNIFKLEEYQLKKRWYCVLVILMTTIIVYTRKALHFCISIYAILKRKCHYRISESLPQL